MKPCPFCGEQADLLVQVEDKVCTARGTLGEGRVICGSCHSKGPLLIWKRPTLYEGFRAEIMQKWNERK